MSEVPTHIPFASTDTHLPFKLAAPVAQTTQSPTSVPVHVLHRGEQLPQVPVEIGNCPSPHEEDGVLQVFGFTTSLVRPVLQVVHSPAGPEQVSQPNEHAVQAPVESLKKPGAQSEHWTLEVRVAYPGEQVHVEFPVPEVGQAPFAQLHDEGPLFTAAVRHFPVPEMVSSHVEHPEGQAK